MSIYETVVCDYCGHVNEGPTVPDKWVSADGQHFDTKYCAVTQWTYYDKEVYAQGAV